MQSRSKVFRTQSEIKSACLMSLDVKSCQESVPKVNRLPKGKW